MTPEQILLFTYMWVWKCDQQFIVREFRIGSFSTIFDWCISAREVCATVLEERSAPIGGEGKIELDKQKEEV